MEKLDNLISRPIFFFLFLVSQNDDEMSLAHIVFKASRHPLMEILSRDLKGVVPSNRNCEQSDNSSLW
jgi:hypothetical protein